MAALYADKKHRGWLVSSVDAVYQSRSRHLHSLEERQSPYLASPKPHPISTLNKVKSITGPQPSLAALEPVAI